MSDIAAQIPLNILVIDDSDTIRRSADLFLRQAGCRVVLVADGFEALANMTENSPDLIFCDILMPRLDGYQTCALIKKMQDFMQLRSLCCRPRTVCLIGPAPQWSARPRS